jgi:hypothetical protein
MEWRAEKRCRWLGGEAQVIANEPVPPEVDTMEDMNY